MFPTTSEPLGALGGGYTFQFPTTSDPWARRHPRKKNEDEETMETPGNGDYNQNAKAEVHNAALSTKQKMIELFNY